MTPTPKPMTAEQAIKESIRTNTVVHIDYDAEAVLTLGAECDDNARTQDGEGNGVWEYWGEDEDGSTWRVHVTVEAK